MGANMPTLFPAGNFSRRRFVGCSTSSLALAMASARAQSVVSATPEAQKIAAATDLNSHLTVQLSINGQGPFRFVVDTGADRTVISDEVAASLGLIRGPIVNVEGVVRTVPAPTVKLGEMTVGPVRKENLVVPVLPSGLLRADGYLGLDVIDGSRVTFDFRNRVLIVEPSRPAAIYGYTRPNVVVVPVFGTAGRLRASNCRIDGVMTTTIVDSGAEVSVGNSKLLEALSESDPSYLKQGTIMLSGVTGGTIPGRITDINRIRIDNLWLYKSKVVISDLQIFDLWGLSDKPALLIGMNFLRAFNRVTIDYGRKELRFDFASLMVARRA